MRVLLLGSKEYPFGISHKYDKKPGGGIEIHVDKLAKYLSKEGHDVHIITRIFPEQKQYEKIGSISIYRTKFIYNKYLRNFTFNFFSFLKAWKIIRKEKIDVIHCHGAVAGFFGSLLSKFTKKPMFFTPHGLSWKWLFGVQQTLMFFENHAAKNSKKTLFISAAAQKKLTKRAKFKNILLSNAIDLDDYKPTVKRTWKPIRFLFSGRLEEIKGLKYLLPAFKKLSETVNKCELWIAGDGTMCNYVEEFISKNKLEDRIKFLGWRTDVDKILQQTDVFVLPSWETGQPVALLEAFASGKIILTSLDFITDDKDGIKIKAKNFDDLYEKMLDITKNLKNYEKLQKEARKTAEKFAWENVVKNFIKEYESIV